MLIPVAQRSGVAGRLAGPLGLSAAAITDDAQSPVQPAIRGAGQRRLGDDGAQISALQLPGIDMTAELHHRLPERGAGVEHRRVHQQPRRRHQPGGAQGLEARSTTRRWRAGLAARKSKWAPTIEPIPLTEIKLSPAVPARSLRLTIQADIQYEADQVCKLRVEQTHARNCSIVVMQPKTGRDPGDGAVADL